MVKKLFFWSLKLSLIALAVFFLFKKLDRLDLNNIDWAWHVQSTFYLFSFFLVWLANISLDARAWQIVQSTLHHIPLKTAFIHNLKCYGLAFISPMNSGEIAGRYLIQDNPYDRKKALFLTFWTHAPKLFSKALLSFIILAMLLPTQGFNYWYSLGLIAASLLGLGLYLRLERVISLLDEKHLWNRPLKHYLVKGKPSLSQKLAVLSINAIRFLLFSSQLALILLAFKPDIIDWNLYWTIPLFYFLSALIPSYTGIDFLIKGTLALYFFEIFEADSLSFTLGSTAVWLANWALPAIIGLSLLKQKDIQRLKRKKS